MSGPLGVLARCGGGVYTRSLCIGDFYFGSPLELVALRVVEVGRVLGFVAGRLLALVLALFALVRSLFTGIRSTLYLIAVMAGLWIVWLSFPTLVGVLRDVFWPFITMFIMYIQFYFNWSLQMYDLIALQVYNNAVPLLGSILQVWLSVIYTYYTMLIRMLGGPAVSTLVESVIRLRDFYLGFCISIIEAIMPIAAPLLQVVIEIAGPVVALVLQAVLFYYTWLFWIYITMFQQLFPLFKQLLWVIKKVTDFFSSASVASFALRALLATAPLHALPSHPRIANSQQYDDLQYSYWSGMAVATRRYWSEHALEVATNEVQAMADFTHSIHPHSFQWNYEMTHSVWRPSYTSYGDAMTVAALSSMHRVRGLLVDDSGNSVNGTLSSSSSGEPLELFDANAPREHDGVAHESKDWHANNNNGAEPGRHAAAERMRHMHRSVRSYLESLPGHRAARRYHEAHAQRSSNSEEALLVHERDRRIPCRSRHCGGHGATLPHPLRAIGEQHDEVRAWSPAATLHVPTLDEERVRYVHVAAHAHAARAALKHYHTHSTSVRAHTHLERMAGEAFTRITGHANVSDAIEAMLSNYGSLADIVHVHALVPSEWPLLRALKDADPTRHERPYWGDWLREREVHELNETDTYGRTYRTFHVRVDDSLVHEHDRTVRRGGGRHLNTLAPLLDLLASTDCFRSVPRNPLCAPDIFPDWLRLDFGFPLATPAWMINPDELCDAYFLPVSRVLPYPGLIDVLQYVFAGPWVIGWQRYVNGLQAIRLALSFFFPVATFAIEQFGVEFPHFAWVSEALLALPGGARPSFELLICIFIVHAFDVALLFVTGMALGRVMSPLQWLHGSYLSVVALRTLFSTWERERIERASGGYESQAFNTASDSEMNAGQVRTGDRWRDRRNWLGEVEHGAPMFPLEMVPPIDVSVRARDYSRQAQRWGDGTGQPYYRPIEQRNAFDRHAATAQWRPTGADGAYENHGAAANYEAPMYAPQPPSSQQSIGAEQVSDAHLAHVGDLLDEGLRTWGQPWHAMERSDVVRWEHRWRFLLRPHEYTYDYVRQTLNLIEERLHRERNYLPMPGFLRAAVAS